MVCVENEQVLCNIDEVFLFFLFAIGDLFDLCLRAIVQRVHIQCKNICSHNVPYPFHQPYSPVSHIKTDLSMYIGHKKKLLFHLHCKMTPSEQ